MPKQTQNLNQNSGQNKKQKRSPKKEPLSLMTVKTLLVILIFTALGTIIIGGVYIIGECYKKTSRNNLVISDFDKIKDPAIVNSFLQSAEILGISLPIEIEKMLFYSDGGTTGVIVKDADGKDFSFCLDGRMREMGIEKEPEPYHIYFKATHPTDTNAQKILISGEKEKAILNILQDWMNKQASKEEQTRLLNIRTVVGLSEEELKIYRILKVIKRLEDRNRIIDQSDTSDWQTYRNEEFGFEMKYPKNWEHNLKDGNSPFQGSTLMENSVAFRPINDRSNVNFEVAFSSLPIKNNDYCLNDKEETIYINNVKTVKCKISLDPDDYKDEPAFGYEGDMGTKVFLSKDSSHNYVIYFKDETIVEYKTVLNQILSTFKFIEKDETADENKPSIYSSKIGRKRERSLLLLNGEKTGFPAYEFEKENIILFQEEIYDEEKSQNHCSLKTISTVSPYEIKTLIDNRHTNGMDNGRFLGEKNDVYFFETEIDAPGSYYELFLFNPVNMDFVLIINFYRYYNGPYSISLYSSASRTSFNFEKRSRISVTTGEILLPNDSDIEIIFNEKSFTKKEVDQGKADYIKDIFNYNFAPFAPINTDEINNKESNDSADAYLKYFPEKIPYFTNEWYKYEGTMEDFWANPDGYFDFEKNEFISSL